MANDGILQTDRVRVSGSFVDLQDRLHELGWTDGLPVAPPMDEAVLSMLRGTRRQPQEVVAVIPPDMGQASVETIAVNAVMAGCRPQYLPVVIAAVEAMAQPQFPLAAMQVTTHAIAPLVIVNGPIRTKLGMNSRTGAFGPGNRANATIGRAVRLVLINVGGSKAWTKCTLGHPGQYTFCIAENEEESPWEPLHVERGFPADASVVTVDAVEAPRGLSDPGSRNALEVLTTVSLALSDPATSQIKYQRGEPIICFGIEHAATIARDGLTKDQVKEYVFEHAGIPIQRISEGNRLLRKAFPDTYMDVGEDGILPIGTSKDNLVIIVAGGEGKHSCWLPTGVDSPAVSRLIADIPE
ncbi:MAG: hypothetical protein HYX92_03190 [Chloroflexi bacterium]|nr:hypothetical protein [Chloroflexota bacterium]